MIEFPPFQLDLRAGLLRGATAPVPLRPKTFAVLQHLAEHPGELVTKHALLDAVWGGVAVTEDVVRLSVGELRAALGDKRAAPRFIETVPRRGYRFVAATGATPMSASLGMAESPVDAQRGPEGVVVGRYRERAEIADWFRAATRVRRQIGFVTGEAGIGKTTLVELALDDLRRTPGQQRAGSASSSTGAASPICRSSRRWRGSVVARTVRRCRNRSASTHPTGSYECWSWQVPG